MYRLSVKEVVKRMSSQKGLTVVQAAKRLRDDGHNEIQKGESTPAYKIFLSQFTNPLVLLLIFAAGIALFLGEFIDSSAMIFIVFMTAGLGFFQEFRAEKAMEALRKIAAPECKVMRNGKVVKIKSRDAVVGDILLVEAGDIVAADARLVEQIHLQVDQAPLTGESVPIKKHTDKIGKVSRIADAANMIFAGTVITYGKGRAVIISTSMNTEFGKIAMSLKLEEETKTPLQIKFTQMAKQIGITVIFLIMIIFGVGLLKGTSNVNELFFFALSLTVAAVPNSLPVVVTVGLSLGANRLAKQNMLIKKLPAAESLGSVTFICSDKTGTITRNEMTVKALYAGFKEYKVSGSGYSTHGSILFDDEKIRSDDSSMLARIGYVCNNAQLMKGKVIGDPTEGALLVLGHKAGVGKNYSRVDELPFDSERKRMSVVIKEGSKRIAYVKGAPDFLLKVCSRIQVNGKIRNITSKDKKKIMKQNDKMASNALRVLGCAYKTIKGKKIESDLVFVGLSGMIDPPREGITKAIEQCGDAGIKVMMITGDHAITAKAVAQSTGLYREGDIIITGEELQKITDQKLKKIINKIRIVARAMPIQKVRIVKALQSKGHIVAMTGDGVNDAPALKKADIGISMGITGTDVSKEVSKAMLVDDNFSTIVKGVMEGRTIYDKMIKSVRYLLSCNAGEIIAVFLSIMMGLPLPMIPLQILMMNLLTDNFPALGLGFEHAEEDVMKRKPRKPHASPISIGMFALIAAFGLFMGAGTLYAFYTYLPQGLRIAQTVAFTTLVVIEMFAVISSRSFYFSFKSLNPFSNMWLFGGVALSVILQLSVVYVPFLQNIFGTTALAIHDWILILVIGLAAFVVMEISKMFLKLSHSLG